MTAYQQAIELAPETSYYKKLGDLLLKYKKNEEALIAYNQALLLNPLQPLLLQQKGYALLALLRHTEALTLFEQSLSQDTNDANSYHGKGQALIGLKRLEEALVAYQHAVHVAAAPINPQFYHNIGVIHEHLARQAFEQEEQAQSNWPVQVQDIVTKVLRPEALIVQRTLTGHTYFV